MPFYHLINLLIVLLFSGLNTRHTDQRTEVSIKDESFYINDLITYPDRYWEGYRVEGLLLNSRMVQGIFDDLNPATEILWKYPDTQKWDPERNTNEFVAAMTGWHAHGLLSFTINLQGGSPMGYGNRDWYNSAYFEDGRLRPEYMARLKKILDKADTLGMVPIVGLFYFGQDQHLADDNAVIRGATNVIEWLHSEGYKNILIEVANECDNNKYDRNILKADRIHELITLIKGIQKNGYRYLVSTSYNGGSIPGENVVRMADFILLHGNGVHEPEGITEMVRKTKEVNGFKPMPILFNEDDHFEFNAPENNFVKAIRAYASWGYFDFRMEGEGFESGYQSVPVDWGIRSDRKKQFFQKLREIAGR